MSRLLAHIVGFGRELRTAGVGVTPPQLERFVRALGLVGMERPRDVRAAARATLATSHDEAATLDAVFDRVWLQHTPSPPATTVPPPPRLTAEVAIARRLGMDRTAEPQDVSDRTATWSQAEHLRHKRFDRLTPEEAAEVRRLVERAPWPRAERRTRRFRRAASGRVPDWRRTIREAVRHDGEILVRRYRTRATRPRPLVVLVDVSGSMERFARGILTFVHVTAQRARRRRHRAPVEVFVFGTRLTRVTRAFASRDVDEALAAATARAPDWSGGTRIGEALHGFNRQWARRVLNRGPVVVVVSDGWDQGDPEQIAREMARLQRTSTRLVWVHPLAGTRGFEPATRGLIAALPFVDALVPGGTLAELERALRALGAASGRPHRWTRSRAGAADTALPDARSADVRQVRQPPSGRSL